MKGILENKKYIFLLCFPAMLLFSAFVIYPLLSIIVMSMQKTNGLTTEKFVWFENFKTLINNTSFIKANFASIGLCILAVIFNAILAVVVAVLMCTLDTRVQKILRTAYIIPLVLSISVISQLWLTVYHADWGLLNHILNGIGLGFLQNEWLINHKTAMICVAIVGMWWMFGMDFLMVYSGIKAIPENYFEAASLDGAGFFDTVHYITLPLLKDVISTCVTISAIGGLFTFPQVYIMTQGGPGDLTQTVMMFMYNQAFSNQRYGMAAAVGVVVILETCAIIYLLGRIFRIKKR